MLLVIVFERSYNKEICKWKKIESVVVVRSKIHVEFLNLSLESLSHHHHLDYRSVVGSKRNEFFFFYYEMCVCARRRREKKNTRFQSILLIIIIQIFWNKNYKSQDYTAPRCARVLKQIFVLFFFFTLHDWFENVFKILEILCIILCRWVIIYYTYIVYVPFILHWGCWISETDVLNENHIFFLFTHTHDSSLFHIIGPPTKPPRRSNRARRYRFYYNSIYYSINGSGVYLHVKKKNNK